MEAGAIMFDFSKGEIVTQAGTTEDIDIITGAKEGYIRFIARNGAEIKVRGSAFYTLYVDAYAGATCELIDRNGGEATFTVDEINTNSTTDNPTATITWTYVR